MVVSRRLSWPSLLLVLQEVAAFTPLRAPRRCATACASRRGLGVWCQETATVKPKPKPKLDEPKIDSPKKYANYWSKLLTREYEETADQLRIARSTWTPERKEAAGLGIFGAHARLASTLYGEKIVNVSKPGAKRLGERFSRGDILILQPDAFASMSIYESREVCVMDTGKDWIAIGVGRSWPEGLLHARETGEKCGVKLERAAPRGTLRAQEESLQEIKKGRGGESAKLLASGADALEQEASLLPPRFVRQIPGIEEDPPQTVADDPSILNAIRFAIDLAKGNEKPNPSQQEAIEWALGRRLSLIRGPPGTGKTSTAALLIASALRARVPRQDGSSSPPTRILAVAHSNGAADVMLSAMLKLGVAGVRAGRAASVAPDVRSRTAAALAEKHPEVVRLKETARNKSLPIEERAEAANELPDVQNQVRDFILSRAPVVVASCVGAHQMLSKNFSFPLVVLDEGSQTTEPALACALAAAGAEQLVIIGDTRQLPPTVVSESPDLRKTLGRSPMARLEQAGVAERTLNVQYRMSAELLEHPSKYFYGSGISCAPERKTSNPPDGFAWPKGMPLCFIDSGRDLEVSHGSGGRSNPGEAEIVAKIISGVLDAEDVPPESVAVIAPYSNQVDLLRTTLPSEIRVGTVDSFQGQEADLVIISATRSNNLGELGFLHDSRRLNVAITRARRGLIVIGDTRTLRSSRHWSALVVSCKSRGCFLSTDYPVRIVANGMNYNSLITACCNVGMIDEALQLFKSMREAGKLPDVITYSSLITSCAVDRRTEMALELFRSMQRAGLVPGSITYSSLVVACANSGKTDTALEIFESMERAGQTPNAISYNSLITTLAKAGRVEEALAVLRSMQQAEKTPSVATYNALITACANEGKTEKALEIFQAMQLTGKTPDVLAYNSLTEGMLRDNYLLFQRASEAGQAARVDDAPRTLLEAFPVNGEVAGTERVQQLMAIQNALTDTLSPLTTASIVTVEKDSEKRFESKAHRDALASFEKELAMRTKYMPRLDEPDSESLELQAFGALGESLGLVDISPGLDSGSKALLALLVHDSGSENLQYSGAKALEITASMKSCVDFREWLTAASAVLGRRFMYQDQAAVTRRIESGRCT